jgi:hypothetical protein
MRLNALSLGARLRLRGSYREPFERFDYRGRIKKDRFCKLDVGKGSTAPQTIERLPVEMEAFGKLCFREIAGKDLRVQRRILRCHDFSQGPFSSIA